jgi:hypothetical protein
LVVKLIASDGTADSYFGHSVAIFGDILVVGAIRADVGGSESQGAAYIFYRNHNGAEQWGQVQKISSGGAWDEFGSAVAISHDTIVVGAPNASPADPGAAYVFSRNMGGADNWGLVQQLYPSETGDYHYFGSAVAIDGDTIVVGREGDDAYPKRGAAYIYVRNHGLADSWDRLMKLTPTDGSEYHYFGQTVDIHDGTIVVGSSPYGICDEGAVYVFSRNFGSADNWGQVTRLISPDIASYESFGEAVSLHGDTLIVAAENPPNCGGNLPGQVYLFSRNEGGNDNWGLTNVLEASDKMINDNFGESLAFHEDTLVVGAGFQAIGQDERRGAAYVYDAIFEVEPGHISYLPLIVR